MPPQIIDIPDVGEVEFPDTMSDAEITAAAKKLHDERMGGDMLVDNVRNIAGTVGDVLAGAAKGAGRTAVGLGRLVHQIPGVSEGVDKLYEMAGVPGVNSARAFGEEQNLSGLGEKPPSAETQLGLQPTNTAQKIGGVIEQGLEYAAPAGAARRAAIAIAPRVLGRVLPTVAAEAVSSAAVAKAQGSDPKTAAVLGAAIPLVGAAASKAAPALKETGIRFARAHLKPTVTEMKQTAGASQTGIDKLADRLAAFVVRNKITTPEKAQALIDDAEATVQSLIGNQTTDEPARAVRYLAALRRSANKQRLPEGDVDAIDRAARELLNNSLGHDVVTTTQTMQPSKILGPNGQPVMVPVTTHTTTRALRPSTPAAEALEAARSSSRWGTKTAWGDLKGVELEAKKTIERAGRDAVKAAVPASKPVFGTYSQAIKARDVLRRSAFRQNNRDVIGLPSQGIGAFEVTRGRIPFIAAATNWLRSNQLKAGIWADQLGNALKNNDVKTATAILGRLGVSLGADAMNTNDMERELLSRTGR